MGKDEPWKPGDGAEQVNPSPAAAEARAETAHFTPQHRSDEEDGNEPFDSGYQQWREANGVRLDSDYRRWRAQTGQPFSQAFLDWAAQEKR